MNTKFGLLLIVVLFFSSCNQTNKTVTEKKQVHQGVTAAVLKSGEYTFIKFNENNNKSIWVATKISHPTPEPQVGEIYFFNDGEMKTNYNLEDNSKTLDTIYFVDKISVDPTVFGLSKDSKIDVSPEAIKPNIEKQEVKVEAAENTITIEN